MENSKETENKESILVPDHQSDHFSNMNHHEFHIEAPSSKGLLFLDQDFDQQFNGGSNHHNIMFGTTHDHSFETSFQYGCNSSTNNFEFYECKPFHHVDNNIMNTTTTTSVMDNFQTGGAGGYLSNYMALVDKNNIGFDHQANKPANFVAGDKVSSRVTGGNRYLKKSLNIKNKKICKSRKKGSNDLVKGQWTIDEDRVLIKMVNQYGLRKWSHIAQILPGRIGKQCRERWHNHLRPDIKKDTWSEEEDKVLIEAHTEIGNKWAEIAKRLPGRTENSIKNHWNATKRRQFSKRKCRSKYPRGSILQDYIKSLNLDYLKRNNPSSSSSYAAPKIPINHITTTTTSLPLESNDRLVPNFVDFNEGVPDFDFDLQENCNIDSLLDEIPSPSPCVNVEKLADHQSVMDFQVKEELDLMEMISQANL